MVNIQTFNLPPTPLIPNSPRPLLYYPNFSFAGSNEKLTDIYDLLSSNGWQPQWIFRYGSTQASHYHSTAHECMMVLSGTARIRFGVADTSNDASEKEEGGIEIEAHRGDVFILPAGVAHKTFDTSPSAEFKLLTPGDGGDVNPQEMRNALTTLELSGFTMMGAYPKDSGLWDFKTGGEHVGEYEKVWSINKPENDPVLGKATDGLCGQW